MGESWSYYLCSQARCNLNPVVACVVANQTPIWQIVWANVVCWDLYNLVWRSDWLREGIRTASQTVTWHFKRSISFCHWDYAVQINKYQFNGWINGSKGWYGGLASKHRGWIQTDLEIWFLTNNWLKGSWFMWKSLKKNITYRHYSRIFPEIMGLGGWLYDCEHYWSRWK